MFPRMHGIVAQAGGPGAGPPPDPFTPADLTDLRLWLDAADAGTITASGGAVSKWTSKDPNAREFVQATGSVQPTTGASTLNSLNVVDFAADWLASNAAASVWKFMHDGTKFDAWAVVKFGASSNPNAAYTLLATSNINSGSHGSGIVFDDRAASGRNDRVWIQNSNNDINTYQTFVLTGDNFFAANTFALLHVQADFGAATRSDAAALRRNAGTIVANNTDTGTPSASNPTYTLHLGITGSSFGVMTGSIAELVIAVDATAGNRSDMLSFLAAKWGITL